MSQPLSLDIYGWVLHIEIYHTRSTCSPIWCSLDGKDVDKLPLILKIAIPTTRDLNLTLALAELAKGVDIVYIAKHRLVDELFALHLMKYLLESTEVLSEHDNINIIIPGYKSLMTLSTK